MIEEYSVMFMAFLPKLIIAIVILMAFYVASRIVSSSILKIGKTGNIGRENIYQLLASAAKMTVMAFGLLISLGTIGIDITPLIAGLGLSGLAVGLALKDAVINLLNGILILIYQPFKKGDIIKIGGSKGRVGEINLRYIQLIDDEGNREFLVPNSLAFSKEIEKTINNNK